MNVCLHRFYSCLIFVIGTVDDEDNYLCGVISVG